MYFVLVSPLRHRLFMHEPLVELLSSISLQENVKSRRKWPRTRKELMPSVLRSNEIEP